MPNIACKTRLSEAVIGGHSCKQEAQRKQPVMVSKPRFCNNFREDAIRRLEMWKVRKYLVLCLNEEGKAATIGHISIITTIAHYNSAPANADITSMPSIPTAVFDTPTCTAAPVSGFPSSPVASGPLLPVRLAPPLGVPVALAVLFPEQRISLGLTPLSMKQVLRSATVCS